MDHDAVEPSRARRTRLRRPIAIPLGRIAGIPVSMSPSWLAAAGLIVVIAHPIVLRSDPVIGRPGAVLVGAALAVLLGVSVLAHELGHCLAARHYGIPVLGVRLYLVGGVSELARLPAKPSAEAWISAAGPAVSAVLAAGCWWGMTLTDAPSLPWLMVTIMGIANGVVAVFNILPALPLDGGRVLRAVVWQLTGRERVATVAGVIGGLIVTVALAFWVALALMAGTREGFLQAAIVAVMAFFVGAGAIAEWPRSRGVTRAQHEQHDEPAAIARWFETQRSPDPHSHDDQRG